MKVIFLDIDGVLNSSASCFVKIGWVQGPFKDADYAVRQGLLCADPVCVALLNRLVKDSDAKVVLSSSHRGYLNGELDALSKYMLYMGLDYDIIDATPRLHRPRGEEVQAWLDEHPEVTHYVILDDGADFHSDQNLVQCDPSHGFDFKNYHEACMFLGTPTSLIIA